MKQFLYYALAVAGFIALSFVTKRFLTWVYGPLYFLAVLEWLPRAWRRARDAVLARARVSLSVPVVDPETP